MKAKDFLFDTMKLSQFNCTICYFDSGSDGSISNGSQIEYVTANPAMSPYWNHYATKYTEPISATIQICKMNCKDVNDNIFSPTEISDIMRWLNREDGFHRLQFLDTDDPTSLFNDVFYAAQINVSQILVNGNCIGFELAITTDAPFAYYPVTENLTYINNSTNRGIINDLSDRVGYIYPNLKITTREAGDLKLTNNLDPNNPLIITGCDRGEIITIYGKYMICQSSKGNINTRFNYKFPKVINTYYTKTNEFSSSITVDLSFTCNYPKKIGIC